MLRNYSNNAPPVQLTASVLSTDLQIPVSSSAGFPPPPFSLCLERGTPNQETCLCTSIPDTQHFTVTRGYDGIAARTHSPPCAVEHVTTAADVAEPNKFINLMTANGDLLTYLNGVVIRLPAGVPGQVLQATSGGVGWTGISTGTIPGEIRIWAGLTVPSGWQFCDGSAISRVTYPNTFAAIGTNWGSGDGVTTFNVPDLRGKAPVGAGAGAGLTARALASVGGEEAHILSQTELAAHTHSDSGHTHTAGSHSHTDNGHSHTEGTHSHSDGGHSHGATSTGAQLAYAVFSTQALVAGGNGQQTSYQAFSTGTGFASIGFGGPGSVNTGFASISAVSSGNTGSGNASNQTIGSGSSHNNMQPFAVVNYMIALG